MTDWIVEAVARSPRVLGPIARMAERYPHPHEELGQPGATDYVLALATMRLSGWYAVTSPDRVAVAAHFGPHGYGHGHRLWAIRCLLADTPSGNVTHWRLLLEALAGEARTLKPGFSKLIIFLGDHDAEAAAAASQAGFVPEVALVGAPADDRRCSVLGRILPS